MLTDDQRAHAIEVLTRVAVGDSPYKFAPAEILDALLDAGYHVLHPDDVIREIENNVNFDRNTTGPSYPRKSRLVTRWEPITDPADPQKEKP